MKEDKIDRFVDEYKGDYSTMDEETFKSILVAVHNQGFSRGMDVDNILTNGK